MRQRFTTVAIDGKSHGFTLLEILIALAILSIALVAVFRLHAQSIDLSEEIAFNTHAPFLADRVLSTLMIEGVDGAVNDRGTFDEAGVPILWQADISEVALPLEESAAPKLWRIDIAISAGPRLNYGFTTYRRHQE